jgi:ribulose-5-phosphate 4-epimerase/fuculose-1-phosphate aldolase
VLHRIDPESGPAYRRKSAPTFVVAIANMGTTPDDILSAGYPLLLRGLANLALMFSDGPTGPVAQFTTLEQGTYEVTHAGNDDEFFARLVGRIEPLATSRLVIANEMRPDLPEELWEGDATTRQISAAGERLAELDLLPAPFPIEEILSPRDLRHVKLLYGLGGLSYGNLSARHTDDGELGPEFWMSASGVDKADLHEIGRDILLVRGYDPDLDAIVLSVPLGIEPRRVSVDAIEHWKIYSEHPDVGANVHVHAWINGTRATEMNYPCGTIELATAVADLVREAPDPSRAVVGQKNHGLTITGHSLDEIFERVGDKIVPNVPMD